MAEKVITEFELDIQQFEEAINKAIEGVEGYDKATEDAAKATGLLNTRFGSASQRIKEASVIWKQLKQEAGGTVPALKAVGSELTTVGKSRLTAVIDGAKNLAKEFKEGVTRAVQGAGKELRGFTQQIGSELNSALPGVGKIGQLFTGATGAIGLAAGAVAGFINNFRRLDAVSTALDAVSIRLDSIRDRLANLDFRGLFDPAVQARDAAASIFIAESLDVIKDRQLDVNKATAEGEKQLASLTQKLRDVTLSEEERLDIAEQIGRVEAQRAEAEQKILRERIAVQKVANNLQIQALGEVSDANKAALSELEVQLINAQTRSIQLTEQTERRRNSIIEQGNAERLRNEEKAARELEAAQREAAKRQQEIARAEQQALAIVAKAREDAELSTLDQNQRAIREIELRYQREVDAARNAFAQLAQLSKPGDRAAIAQQEADAIALIEESLQAKLDELRAGERESIAKRQADATEELRRGLLTREQIQVESIEANFERLRELAQLTIDSEEELSAKLEEIERARIIALAEINSEGAEAELAAQQARQERQLELIEGASQRLNAVIEGAAAGQEDIAKEAGKALLDIALQVLEQQALIATGAAKVLSLSQADSIATFGASGLVRATIIAALIRAALAGVRGAVQGAFHDGGLVGRDGGTRVHGGRDGFITRVERGEYVMPTATTKRYMPYLEAMRDGRFEAMVTQQVVPMAYSSTFSDKGIVGAIATSTAETRRARRLQEENNDILRAMLGQRIRRVTPSKRLF